MKKLEDKLVKLTTGGISKLCNMYKETLSLQHQTGKGRKRCTTTSDDKRSVILSLHDRRKSFECIQDEMAQCNVKLRARTVWCKLGEFIIHARISRSHFYVSNKGLKRLHWAKTYVNWTADKWDSVIWSDETKISLFGNDGIKYVRRRIGEDLHPD